MWRVKLENRQGRDRTACYRNELSVETDLEGPGGSVTFKELPATVFSWMRASTWDTLRAVSSITAALTVVRKSSRKDQRYSTYVTMYRPRSWESHPATYSTCLLAATKDLSELRVVRLDLEDCMRKINCLLRLETGIPVFASLTSAKKLLPARATILGKEESTYLASCSQCCNFLRRTKYCVWRKRTCSACRGGKTDPNHCKVKLTNLSSPLSPLCGFFSNFVLKVCQKLSIQKCLFRDLGSCVKIFLFKKLRQEVMSTSFVLTFHISVICTYDTTWEKMQRVGQRLWRLGLGKHEVNNFKNHTT